MAHFAKLDENNVVIDVVFVNNEDTLDENGNESESCGISFLNDLLGESNWVQTSYNGSFRYNYAQVGGVYDHENEAFIEQKPFDSWVLNTETYTYHPPIPYPDVTKIYSWDEVEQAWVLEQHA